MIKIVLDVPAVDRLIGGDSEVEVELRKGIVQEFARQKLTNLLNDEGIQKLLGPIQAQLNTILPRVRTEVDRILHETIGKVHGGYQIEFKPEIKASIKTAVEAEVHRTIYDVLRPLREEMFERVEEIAKQKIDRAFEQRVQDEIARRIALLAAAFPTTS